MQPTATAAEQHAPLFTSGVLPVMLQHPAVSSSRETVCRLLCSSKAVRSAVLQHASGMLELSAFETQKEHQLSVWLTTHAHLLKTLVFGWLSSEDSVCLAFALQAAATASATPGGLQLQSFGAILPDTMAALILQPLSAKHLTKLSLTLKSAFEPGAEIHPPHPCVQLLAKVLAGLTSLSTLSLRCELWQPVPLNAPAPSADSYLPALSGLSRLTNLQLFGCSKGQLSLLPQHLLELQLSTVAAQPAEQLQLGHLTALTKLVYMAVDDPPLCVQAGDVLPPNLVGLCVDDCSDTGPLAAPTRLTSLFIREAANMSVARLVSGIAQLQQLQELSVSYDDCEAAAGPAAVWPAAAAVLPALTFLDVSYLPTGMVLGAADAISRLSSLTKLNLYASDSVDDLLVAATEVLATSIATLPQLQELHALDIPFGHVRAAAALSAVTSLTSLSLYSAGLTDHSLSHLFASGLTGLRSLAIVGNDDVSAPLMLLLVARLPHLTKLRGIHSNSEGDVECIRHLNSILQQRRPALQ